MTFVGISMDRFASRIYIIHGSPCKRLLWLEATRLVEKMFDGNPAHVTAPQLGRAEVAQRSVDRLLAAQTCRLINGPDLNKRMKTSVGQRVFGYPQF